MNEYAKERLDRIGATLARVQSGARHYVAVLGNGDYGVEMRWTDGTRAVGYMGIETAEEARDLCVVLAHLIPSPDVPDVPRMPRKRRSRYSTHLSDRGLTTLADLMGYTEDEIETVPIVRGFEGYFVVAFVAEPLHIESLPPLD